MPRKMLVAAFAIVLIACAARAADYDKLPKPIETAKEGQWAAHSMPNGMQQKTSVVKVEGEGEDRTIALKTEIMMNGNIIQSVETPIVLKEAKKMEEEARSQLTDAVITEEQVTINGKTYDAVVMTASVDNITVKTYLSKDIPVNAVLKIESDGMGTEGMATVMELIEHGE